MLALGAVAAETAAGVVTVEEDPPKYSIMREEAGTTRSQRPSRWAVDVPAIAMSPPPTSRRFLLPLLGEFAPALLPEGEEEEGADDDEEELADTLGVLLVERGRRRRERRLDGEEEEDDDDDAWLGPGALGLRKDGATGKPLRMLALCVLSVGWGRERLWVSRCVVSHSFVYIIANSRVVLPRRSEQLLPQELEQGPLFSRV